MSARVEAARVAAAASAVKRRETLLQRYAGQLRACGFLVVDKRKTAPTTREASEAVAALDPQHLEKDYIIGWIVGHSPEAVLDAVRAVERLRADHPINA